MTATPDPLALVGLAHERRLQPDPRPGPVDRSTTDALGHGFDLAEALVLAEAVGDEARADRLAGELAALNEPRRRGLSTGPTGPMLTRALANAGAYELEGRHPGRLATLIPGPTMAARDLGLSGHRPDVTGLAADGTRWHLLKVWPEFWPAVQAGTKPFELRKATDRRFELGDVLYLAEWSLVDARFTGRAVARRVTYAVTAAELEALGLSYLAADVVALGLGDAVDLAEAPTNLRPA